MKESAILEEPKPYIALTENKYIIELFSTLKQNGRDSEGLDALINHINSMEDFVMQAESLISEMKTQLDTIKEIQSHPIKSTIEKAIKSLQNNVEMIKTQINELKNEFTMGCKNAINAFKDNGIIALDKLASFFHIKDRLSKIKNSTITGIDNCNNVTAKVEALSKEYHQAGRAIKNMVRLFLGKEPLETIKDPGKLTDIINSPYKAQKICLLGVQQQVNKLINSINKLEQVADSIHTKKENNLKEKLDKNKKKASDRNMKNKPSKTKEPEL